MGLSNLPEINIIQNDRFSSKVNVEMTPEFASTLGAVYGTYLNNDGVIAVARDYRLDSRMLKRAFMAGAMSAGIKLLNLFQYQHQFYNLLSKGLVLMEV